MNQKHGQNRKNLLILYTGGTISSNGSYYKSATKRTLLYILKEHYAVYVDHLQIKEDPFLSILSENMTPGYLEEIILKVTKGINHYDGIIICHGTDTMAFTSALLYYRFSNLDIPLVITGSHLSIDEPDSDAFANLLDAITVAQSAKAGVFVVFGGQVYWGNNLRKVVIGKDCYRNINLPFDSLGCPSTFLTNNDDSKYVCEVDLDDNGNAFHQISDDIAIIPIHPFFEVDLLSDIYRKGKRFIILESYNNGTANALGADSPYSLTSSIKEITDDGGYIFFTSQQLGIVTMDTYDTSRTLVEAGAIPLNYLIKETAAARLSLLSLRVHDREELKNKLLFDSYWGVVQKAERPAVNRKVGGSNPPIPAIRYSNRSKELSVF